MTDLVTNVSNRDYNFICRGRARIRPLSWIHPFRTAQLREFYRQDPATW